MAGGEGKRLHLILTQDCPKPMSRWWNPLEIIFEQCINAGFKKFYLSVNYLKAISRITLVMAQAGDYIDYVEEDRPLGTGGALSLLPETPVEPFLLINGDI